jgi:hypothetical protein
MVGVDEDDDLVPLTGSVDASEDSRRTVSPQWGFGSAVVNDRESRLGSRPSRSARRHAGTLAIPSRNSCLKEIFRDTIPVAMTSGRSFIRICI